MNILNWLKNTQTKIIMERKLETLEEAYYLSTIKANNDTRRLAKWSIFISIIGLVSQMFNSDWVQYLYLNKIIEKSGSQYSIPIIISNYSDMLLVILVAFLICEACIILYSKYVNDYTFQIGILRSFPIVAVFGILAMIVGVFKEPLASFPFLFAIGFSCLLIWLIFKAIMEFIGYFRSNNMQSK